MFAELLEDWDRRPLKVLDAGCGAGRNTVYMAQRGHSVTALDFDDSALNQLQQTIDREGLGDRVEICEHSLQQSLPFPGGVFDVIVDSYVSCHFIEKDLMAHYLSEIHRVSGEEGRIFSSQFSVDDEYYQELVRLPAESAPVVLDPCNRIAKRLYSPDSVKELFSPLFQLRYFAQFEFNDLVLGRLYHRVVFALVLEK